jgi:formyltetrahydrofolate-dependent phosphoribosylglycinamide formyltransferase
LERLRLGVFASGRGSNFASILGAIDSGALAAEVRLLVSNCPDAGALELAARRGIPAEVVASAGFPSREEFVDALLKTLERREVSFIALAGYMKRIPAEVIARYPNRICNIHPALLPSFGGKGMFGRRVHEAVLAYGCKVTGVTVHLVDERYDQGPIVLQRCVPVRDDDTAETLAARVLETEHAAFPEALRLFAEGRVAIEGRKVSIR